MNGTPSKSAEARLTRLLHVIPAAAREGGVEIDKVAADLGVDPKTVLEDLEEVSARSFYHPGGSDTAEAWQVMVEHQRIRIWTTGPLRRPVKLSPREALCLAMGLRAFADRTDDSGRTLLERLEKELAVISEEVRAEALRGSFHVDALDHGPVRELLAAAARKGERVRIRYLKPDAPAPEERVVDPYLLLHSSGHWYTLGHCHQAEGVRLFRLDRVLDAEKEGAGFERPADLDPEEYLTDGHPFFVDDEEAVRTVRVRYGPTIARWIAERHPEAEHLDDGSVVVEYPVGKSSWIVRHVLQYGPDAEVLEPDELRAQVRGVAERLAG